ncbi:hypothetical protein EIKCOROL_02291 [Eikenella corrodens ATCC 23834]|uniref:Uncharacterized protein n=1 Tax=Eikenella corrodens ATCC 23834 TaxID=546274 RepID=C0DY30_EIKCO|nr:hypothetical protein EIKCOROL_02291 [Eikenella corrodens ATCC 23834]
MFNLLIRLRVTAFGLPFKIIWSGGMVYQGYLKNIPPFFQVAFPALPEAT